MKTRQVQVERWNRKKSSNQRELLAVEQPLSIRVCRTDLAEQQLAVTLRTPGNDHELVAGYLYCEGIIQNRKDCSIEQVSENIVRVQLARHVNFSQRQVARGSFIHSGCGLCGKTFAEALHTIRDHFQEIQPLVFRPEWIKTIASAMKHKQHLFASTGGSHAAALFTHHGQCQAVYEDIGRHNAVDKIVGSALLTANPANGKVMWISGRAGFELVQKAIMAGVGMLIAVGAPSSLAVEMAEEFNMTLVAFARDGRANLYHQGE